MSIRAIVFDYDGTILDSLSSVNRLSVFVKLFCFKYMRWCYSLFEAVEILLRFRWPVHASSIACMRWASEQGILTGIATDRSVLGLISSARRSDFDFAGAVFLHVRSSVWDLWIQAPIETVLLKSEGRKDASGGLRNLCGWLAVRGIHSSQVLMVGDDERDRRAAAEHGFLFAWVDRYCPDFDVIYQLMAPAVSRALGE